MLVHHVMTRGVETFPPGALCRDVLEAFRRLKIRHAPVVSDGALVGVVSERDLLRHLPASVAELECSRHALLDVPLSRAMTHRPVVCRPNEPIDAVAARMLARRVGCLPVLDGGEVVGIVTQADLLRFLAGVATHPAERRVVLLRVPRDKAPPRTPAELCASMRVELACLLRHDVPNGTTLYLLGLRAPEEDVQRFLRGAAILGYLLLESSGEGEPADERRAG